MSENSEKHLSSNSLSESIKRAKVQKSIWLFTYLVEKASLRKIEKKSDDNIKTSAKEHHGAPGAR